MENTNEYAKDFDAWNEKKKAIHGQNMPAGFFFPEREIWWASLGVNVGMEMDGKHQHFERPILILRKFSNDALWALPNKVIWLLRKSDSPQNG